MDGWWGWRKDWKKSMGIIFMLISFFSLSLRCIFSRFIFPLPLSLSSSYLNFAFLIIIRYSLSMSSISRFFVPFESGLIWLLAPLATDTEVLPNCKLRLLPSLGQAGKGFFKTKADRESVGLLPHSTELGKWTRKLTSLGRNRTDSLGRHVDFWLSKLGVDSAQCHHLNKISYVFLKIAPLKSLNFEGSVEMVVSTASSVSRWLQVRFLDRKWWVACCWMIEDDFSDENNSWKPNPILGCCFKLAHVWNGGCILNF